MENKANEFILQRKKKKKIKKIITLGILFLCIFIIFLFKAPLFQIHTVKVENNNIIDSNEIIKLSKISNTNNIFYLNIKDTIKNVKRNPYISQVSIKRVLPDKIIINVTEKSAAFYVNIDGEYYILNDDLRILEKKVELNTENLLEIKGIDIKSQDVGEIITNNEKQIKLTKELYEILSNNVSNIKFTSMDISNLYNLILYSGNVQIKLGNDEELKDKINKAINILESKDVNLTKGYIDLSFKGNTVIKQES
ncbi:cell division protein FtsQ/DivIB [Clostridium fallax]|uniref:Cell division protein FtsQ n=1 Tax=Clostridium fallax TaxID=1533 RepID=A0A1M4YJ67_9CLOT|nr:FtsQ-type POTRA domain-containing protein [Clostridium fallax]SHF05760.1 cell division protein FtsQ [Clostridium fallax]SQB06304.1 cell division protein [Clostridium fallax]